MAYSMFPNRAGGSSLYLKSAAAGLLFNPMKKYLSLEGASSLMGGNPQPTQAPEYQADMSDLQQPMPVSINDMMDKYDQFLQQRQIDPDELVMPKKRMRLKRANLLSTLANVGGGLAGAAGGALPGAYLGYKGTKFVTDRLEGKHKHRQEKKGSMNETSNMKWASSVGSNLAMAAGGTGLGALLGLAKAPEGNRLEGTARGAAKGLGTGIGMGLGGGLGALGGAVGGAGLGALGGAGTHSLMKYLYPNMESDQNMPGYPGTGAGAVTGAGLGALAGGAAGTVGGGVGGYHLMGNVLGKPSWKKKGNAMMGYGNGSGSTSAPSIGGPLSTDTGIGGMASSLPMAPTGITGTSMPMSSMKMAHVLGLVTGQLAARHEAKRAAAMGFTAPKPPVQMGFTAPKPPVPAGVGKLDPGANMGQNKSYVERDVATALGAGKPPTSRPQMGFTAPKPQVQMGFTASK